MMSVVKNTTANLHAFRINVFPVKTPEKQLRNGRSEIHEEPYESRFVFHRLKKAYIFIISSPSIVCFCNYQCRFEACQTNGKIAAENLTRELRTRYFVQLLGKSAM